MNQDLGPDLLADQTDDTESELARDGEGRLSVLVMYQGVRAYAQMAGYTAFEVKRSLKDQWAIPYIATVHLNGHPANALARLHNGDRLRFVRVGSKAAVDGVSPARELLDRLIELRAIIVATVTAKMNPEQKAEAITTAVLRLCLPMFGPPTSGPDRVMLAEVIQLAHQQGNVGPAGSLSDLLVRIDKQSVELSAERRPEVPALGNSPYLDLKNAAVYCHLAEQTIYNHSKEIRAHRRGRRGLLFTREALDDWIAGKKLNDTEKG